MKRNIVDTGFYLCRYVIAGGDNVVFGKVPLLQKTRDSYIVTCFVCTIRWSIINNLLTFLQVNVGGIYFSRERSSRITQTQSNGPRETVGRH